MTDYELDDNDSSAVSLIEFAGKKILLCSDIGKFAQKEIMRLFPDLKADIVVVPHHGSVRTLEADFLSTLDADILIYSCGRSDYEKQRTARITGRSKTFYTPIDGAVTIRIKKDGTISTVNSRKQERI